MQMLPKRPCAEKGCSHSRRGLTQLDACIQAAETKAALAAALKQIRALGEARNVAERALAAARTAARGSAAQARQRLQQLEQALAAVQARAEKAERDAALRGQHAAEADAQLSRFQVSCLFWLPPMSATL